MKILKSLRLKLVAITLLMSPLVVLADFKADIINSCTDYQKGKDKSGINACKLYIDGFIDSSLLTEDGVVKPKAMINTQPKKQSEFLQRAYQTRVLTTSSMLKDEDAHQFCIPSEYTRTEIASKLAKSIDTSQLNNKQLKEVLFDTLVEDFPCK